MLIITKWPLLLQSRSNEELCFAKELLVQIDGSADGAMHDFFSHGVYFRGLWTLGGISGGMPYWRRGNEALWFAGQRWIMANEKDLGKIQIFGGVRSAVLEAELCPTSASVQWEYYVDTFKKAENGAVNVTHQYLRFVTAYQGKLRK